MSAKEPDWLKRIPTAELKRQQGISEPQGLAALQDAELAEAYEAMDADMAVIHADLVGLSRRVAPEE